MGVVLGPLQRSIGKDKVRRSVRLELGEVAIDPCELRVSFACPIKHRGRVIDSDNARFRPALSQKHRASARTAAQIYGIIQIIEEDVSQQIA